MKKRSMAIVAATAAIVACADFARSGPPRDLRYPDMKIRIVQNDSHGFEITEDAALFNASFAAMNYCEYLLNWAEHKQLAVEVARTVADFLGSTNDIRICHWEQPKPADTNNLGDVLNSWLKGRYVTDEIVPLRREGE